MPPTPCGSRADAPSRPDAAPARVTVVVADDNARFRDGLVRALRRHPGAIVVAEVGDGVAAIDAARRLHPDVVVLDDRMPLLDGVGAARRMAEDPRLDDVRVVLLTAAPSAELDARAAAAGVGPRLDKNAARSAICAAILREARR